MTGTLVGGGAQWSAENSIAQARRLSPPNGNTVPVPSKVLLTEGLSAAEKFERFSEFFYRLFEFSPTSDIEYFDRAYNCTWKIEEVLYGHSICGAMKTSTRTRGRSVLTDYVAVRRYQSGRAIGRAGDQCVDLDARAVHVLDLAELTGVQSAVDSQAVIIPRHVVPHLLARGENHRSFGLETPTGRLLATAISIMFEQLPKARASDAQGLHAGLLALLQAIPSDCAPTADLSGHSRHARALAMRRFVADHLTDRDLSAESLAAAFAVSRATVYRAFDELGGLQRHITQLRLERAKSELARMPRARGSVVKVAERWGSQSHGHFTRLFRDRFGMPPRDVLGAYRCTTDGHEAFTRQRASANGNPRLMEF